MEKNGRFHWGSGNFARVVRLPSVNNSPSGSCESLADDFDQLLSLDRRRSTYFADDYANSPESFRRSLQQLEEYRKISHLGYNTGQCFNMSSSISSDCDDWCTVDLMSPVEQQKFIVWPPANRPRPTTEYVELSKPDLLAISEQTRQMERRNEELRQEQLIHHQQGRGCFQTVNSCLLLDSASLNSNTNTSRTSGEVHSVDKNSQFSKRNFKTFHTHTLTASGSRLK
ncbi:hypothetical protein D917_09128 [Trichinella nativa]|uniref:Uncharacterized protein n=1 Tax=Trichinella nativa TaxID=6335 RepID=A0A1Y3EH10_9BILA|nr:hypothetical protein D917_09128 [Trichinella nativa]